MIDFLSVNQIVLVLVRALNIERAARMFMQVSGGPRFLKPKQEIKTEVVDPDIWSAQTLPAVVRLNCRK